MSLDPEEVLLIDDLSDTAATANGNRWQYVSDTVMGGVSQGMAEHISVQGRRALQLSGTVSLDNNGGFIQAALDLGRSHTLLDAGDASGIAVTLCGDGGSYAINLRTSDTQRPWQSYRSSVHSSEQWKTYYLPFAGFTAHRIEQSLDAHCLRRLGIIAIGAPGPARVAIARLALYRQQP